MTNLETFAYLGYVTKNADNSISSTAFRACGNLSRDGVHLESMQSLAGTIAAQAWDGATAEIASEQFAPGTRVNVRDSAFNRVKYSGTVKRHIIERGRTYCDVMPEGEHVTRRESVDSLDTI